MLSHSFQARKGGAVTIPEISGSYSVCLDGPITQSQIAPWVGHCFGASALQQPMEVWMSGILTSAITRARQSHPVDLGGVTA